MNNKNKFLGYGKVLPAPFQNMQLRNLAEGFKSKYTDATLRVTHASAITTALMDVFKAMNHNDESRVSMGVTASGDVLVEYIDANAADRTQYVLMDTDTLEAKGCVFDTAIRHETTYALDGENSFEALIVSLLDVFEQDEEFYTNYEKVKSAYDSNYGDGNEEELTESYKAFTILGENVNRRIQDSMLEESISIDLNGDKLPLLTLASLKGEECKPNTIVFGRFEEYQKLTGIDLFSTDSSTEALCTISEFFAQYDIDPERNWTGEELMLRENSRLKPNTVVTNVAVDICKIIWNSFKTENPLTVFSLKGDAGSGKSTIYRIIMNGLGIPWLIQGLNSDTDRFSVLGTYVPVEDADSDLMEKFKKLGGVNGQTVVNVFNLPDMSNIMAAPDLSYMMLTNKEVVYVEGQNDKYVVDGKEITKDEFIPIVLDAWNNKIAEKIKEVINEKGSEGKRKYKFVPSNIVIAASKGYGCEIQESDTVRDEGLLVLLNSLFEERIITLPTGETLKVHRDAVFCFTNNVGYKGCKQMNNSVIDRWQFGYELNTPSAEEMARRAMAKTGNCNDKQVVAMAKIIKDIDDEMKEQGIKDGITGQRALNSWATMALFMNPDDAFSPAVLFKTSLKQESKDLLYQIFTESPYRRDIYVAKK